MLGSSFCHRDGRLLKPAVSQDHHHRGFRADHVGVVRTSDGCWSGSRRRPVDVRPDDIAPMSTTRTRQGRFGNGADQGRGLARATKSRRQSWKAGGAACCSSGSPWLPNEALGIRFNEPCQRPVRCAGWLGGCFSHRDEPKHSLVIGTSYPQGLRLHLPDEFYARQLLASTAKGISRGVSVACWGLFL